MLKKLGLKLKEQKGFTLIELLAVIVILGIIAAIAVPAIANVINKSETKSQAQEAVQIINAAKLYVADKGKKFSDFDTEAEALDMSELGEYLDRVDAGFKVTYEAVGSGTPTYVISGHAINTTKSEPKLTEQKVVEYSR